MAGFSDEDVCLLLSYIFLRKKKKRRHRWWVHNIIENRRQHGAFYHLVPELELDEIKFKEYFRVNKSQFDEILNYIGPAISRRNLTREAICSKQMLAICLRCVSYFIIESTYMKESKLCKTVPSKEHL